MVFILCNREYPAIRFAYKTASERYLVAELWAKQFCVFLEKNEILIFFKSYFNEGHWKPDKDLKVHATIMQQTWNIVVKPTKQTLNNPETPLKTFETVLKHKLDTEQFVDIKEIWHNLHPNISIRI